MKRAVSILMAFLMLFSLTACGQNGGISTTEPTGTSESTSLAVSPTEIAAPTTTPSKATSESITEAAMDSAAQPAIQGKALIVYFSWSSSGNTEKMANVIQERTGGDILKLEPAVPYPTDYNECGDVAKVERDENARPEIANLPDSLDEYNTIFVGYPIWWHTAPMIIGTFLESYDLSGKEVYPFSQSSSMDTEQFEASMDFVRTSAMGATVHDGLFVDASDTDGILAYLTENDF